MGLTAIASDTAIGMPIATAVSGTGPPIQRSTTPRKSTSSVNAIVTGSTLLFATGSGARGGPVPRMALLVAGRIRAHCRFGRRERNEQCGGNGGDRVKSTDVAAAGGPAESS